MRRQCSKEFCESVDLRSDGSEYNCSLTVLACRNSYMCQIFACEWTQIERKYSQFLQILLNDFRIETFSLKIKIQLQKVADQMEFLMVNGERLSSSGVTMNIYRTPIVKESGDLGQSNMDDRRWLWNIYSWAKTRGNIEKKLPAISLDVMKTPASLWTRQKKTKDLTKCLHLIAYWSRPTLGQGENMLADLQDKARKIHQ